VEATQFHFLIDVHVGQQINLGVLGEMKGRITRPTLVVS
jgi:hypothetical protein